MLHAFNANTGVEQFAYVPGILSMAKLRDLSRGDYTHKFMVDGPVAVSPRTSVPSSNAALRCTLSSVAGSTRSLSRTACALPHHIDGLPAT